MPKQLNNGKITEALQAAFGFKGRYNPMLDEVIVPTYEISDPLPAEPQRIYGARVVCSASVGEVCQARFLNPAGSGNLVMITGVSIAAFDVVGGPAGKVIGVAFQYGATSDLADYAGVIRGRDTRNKVGTRVRITGANKAAQAPYTSTWALSLIKTDDVVAEVVSGNQSIGRQPMTVLKQGISLDVEMFGTDALNIPLLVNFQWLEVPALQTPARGTP